MQSVFFASCHAEKEPKRYHLPESGHRACGFPCRLVWSLPDDESSVGGSSDRAGRQGQTAQAQRGQAPTAQSTVRHKIHSPLHPLQAGKNTLAKGRYPHQAGAGTAAEGICLTWIFNKLPKKKWFPLTDNNSGSHSPEFEISKP